MPEVSDGINQLFTSGLSREAFIERYQQLSESKQFPEESVFSKDMSTAVLSAMYDTFHHSSKAGAIDNSEEVSTENDIKLLAGFDGDENSISEQDLIQLYKQTISKFDNIQVSYDDIIDGGSDTNTMYPTEAVEFLKFVKTVKIQEANKEIQKIQLEIDKLIINTKGISDEAKTEYNSSKQNAETAQQNIDKKQKEYSLNKNKIDEIANNIARKSGELDTTEDEQHKNELKGEIDKFSNLSKSYNKNLSSISAELTRLNSTLKIANTRMESVTNKILKNDKKTAQKVKIKQTRIDDIRTRLDNELKEIDTRIDDIHKQQVEHSYNIGKDAGLYINNPPVYNPNAVDFSALEAKGVKYSNTKGQRLANEIMRHSVGFTGNCSRYVREGLQRTGLHNGHTQHAYQMADVLANNKDFQEISTGNIDLKKLPAGCILVYERGARRDNGKTYSKTSGHIEVTLGDGTACSDGRTRNISSRDVRVFVPIERA